MGKSKYTIKDVKELFESEGYQLLTTEYTHIHHPLNFICPKGHKHSITWNSFKRGIRCGGCKGNIEVTYEQVKQSFEDEGYQLLSTEYINCDTPLRFICPEGHTHQIVWDKWNNSRQRCGKCGNRSRPEEQLFEYVSNTYNTTVISRDRTQIKNPSTGCYLEFDIWLPDLNKAIEMNGVAVHTGGWRPNNDVLKNQLCREKGIPLLTVTDEEWYNLPDYTKERIDQFILGKR